MHFITAWRVDVGEIAELQRTSHNRPEMANLDSTKSGKNR
jgi:hypothetical protein